MADGVPGGRAGRHGDGPVLALAGAVDEGTVTFAAIERRGRAWLPAVPGTLEEATDPAAEVAARQRRAAVEAAVLGNRLRRHGRMDLAAMTALLLLRSAWCHALSRPGELQPCQPEGARAAIRMFAGYALELLDQVEPVANDPRSFMEALSPFPFPHAVYPAACARVVEILGLLGLLAGSPAADAGLPGLPADRISRTVAGLLQHQPGCAHPISDGFAVSLIAPVLLTAGHDATAAASYLCRTAVWTVDRYDPDYGGAGLAGTSADPQTEVAWLLGSAFENGPPRRPWSYIATVLADLSAIILGGADLYADTVNDFLAVEASPLLMRADERRAQWRPDGPSVTLTMQIAYAEPLPPDGIAAKHFTDQGPPVPAWDALALVSVARNRHTVSTLRDNLSRLSS